MAPSDPPSLLFTLFVARSSVQVILAMATKQLVVSKVTFNNALTALAMKDVVSIALDQVVAGVLKIGRRRNRLQLFIPINRAIIERIITFSETSTIVRSPGQGRRWLPLDRIETTRAMGSAST